MIDKNNPEMSWISLILRVAVGLMFVMACFSKFAGGFGTYVTAIMDMFKGSFLPGWLLTPYVYALPFVEGLVGLWLLTGIKLRAGWILTAFVLISLAFGMMVAKQQAGDIYTYVLMVCAGIYTSKFDGCCLGNCGCKK